MRKYIFILCALWLIRGVVRTDQSGIFYTRTRDNRFLGVKGQMRKHRFTSEIPEPRVIQRIPLPFELRGIARDRETSTPPTTHGIIGHFDLETIDFLMGKERFFAPKPDN